MAHTSFMHTLILVRVEEGNGYITLRMKKPQDWVFKSGQYIEIKHSLDAKPIVLAIASGQNDLDIEVTGRANSDPLHPLNQLPGQKLFLSPPQGSSFPVNLVEEHHHLLLLGGGSGITALRSILRTVKHTSTRLIYSHQKACSLLYREEVLAWQRAGHQINLTREIDSQFGYGRIDESIPYEIHSNTFAFLCGPESLVKETASLLISRGMPIEQVYGSLPKTASEGGPVFRGDRLLEL